MNGEPGFDYAVTPLDSPPASEAHLYRVDGFSDNQSRLVVLEPVTLAWIALSIASGVLSAVGARLFTQFFASDSDPWTLIQSNIALIQSIVHQALHEHDRAVLEAQTASLSRLTFEYNNSPHANRLETILIMSSNLVYEADRLGFMAAGSFYLIGSTRLALLQERYNLSHDPMDKASIASFAHDLSDRHHAHFLNGLFSFNRSRFSDPYEINAGHSNSYWEYQMDGKLFGIVKTWEEINHLRRQHIIMEYDRLYQIILMPFSPTLREWRTIWHANE